MLRIALASSLVWLLSLLPVASTRSLVFLDASYYGCTNFIVVLTMVDGKAYRFSHHEPDSFVKYYVRDIKQLRQISLIINEWETRRYDVETLGPRWDSWKGWYEIELRKDYEAGYENSWFRPRAGKRWAVYRDPANSSEDSDDEGLLGLKQDRRVEERPVRGPGFDMQASQVRDAEPADGFNVPKGEVSPHHKLGERRERRGRRARRRR